jgi:hypothetical protein
MIFFMAILRLLVFDANPLAEGWKCQVRPVRAALLPGGGRLGTEKYAIRRLDARRVGGTEKIGNAGHRPRDRAVFQGIDASPTRF